MGYKEQWTEYYEDAIEDGCSEDESCKRADELLADWLSYKLDTARDVAKEKL